MRKLRVLGRAAVVALVGAGAVALPAAPASAAVPGLTIVSAVSAADSTSPKSVVVGCPTGTRVVGAGASVGYVTDEVHVTGTMIGTFYDTITAQATEDDTGYSQSWYLRAVVVCATPPPGYEVIIDYNNPASDPSASTFVQCSTGKELLGGGARIFNSPADVVLNRLQGGDYWFSATGHEDGSGTSATWTITGWAACADPLPGHQVVSYVGYLAMDDLRGDTLTCPAGTGVLGVGASVVQPDTGEVSFTSVRPSAYAGSHFVMVDAAEDQDGLSGYGQWKISLWAVCATL